MANEARLWQDFVGGVVDDDPLTSGATTLNSADLAVLAAVDADHYMVIVLDPDGLDGDPEIVWVTAHTASATSATIARAQEGSSGPREHRLDTPWVHGQTAADMVAQSGAGTPEGAVVAPVGRLYVRTDGGAGTTLYVKESGSGDTGWVGK